MRCRCPTFFTTFVPATEAETPRAFACVCDPPRPATSPNLQPIRAGTFLKSKDLVNDRSGGRLQLAMRHTDLLSEASPETEPPIVASESVPPGWRPRPTVGSRGGGPGSPRRPASTGTKKCVGQTIATSNIIRTRPQQITIQLSVSTPTFCPVNKCASPAPSQSRKQIRPKRRMTHVG